MTRPSDPGERGVSLIVVLLILVIVSILGVGGAQIAMMAERGSRNDRDMQVAWQSAEAALVDAELDIHGPNASANSRQAKFAKLANSNSFVAGCGDRSGVDLAQGQGLCALLEMGKPAWLTVDFTNDTANARTTAFGTFTGRTFGAVAVGGAPLGVQPAKAPRYIIEAIPDFVERNIGTSSRTSQGFLYRVTAMGFGPREDIRAVAQILYRD
jgi:type IV pilus assembly protein PilX